MNAAPSALLFGIRNSRKLYDGLLAGLQNPELMGAKETAEVGIKYQLAQRPEGKDALAAYQRIAVAEGAIERIYVRLRMLESARGFHLRLLLDRSHAPALGRRADQGQRGTPP